jgi:hypothetical protein
VTNVPRPAEGAPSPCPGAPLFGATLEEALEAGAEGAYRAEAGVLLVLAHDRWLRRQDFTDCCVHVSDDGSMAFIEWDDVVDFLDECPCSSSEAAVLKLAASLAGAHVGGSLGELVTGLDAQNLALVLDAVAHANGLHERHMTLTICGEPGMP